VQEYRVDSNLRRDEAAKMLVTFAKATSQLQGRTQNNSCDFTDLTLAYNDLQFYIVEAC
jgi:hypothetical protein